jgi:hypothetical protein
LGSITKILAIRWMLFFISVAVIAAFDTGLNTGETAEIMWFCAFAVALDLTFAMSARRKFKSQFNPASIDAAASRKKFWRRIFGG